VSRDRSNWPIRRHRLGEEPGDDIANVTTPDERLAMMWSLAKEGWALAGRELPVYDRASIPTRLLRPGEPRPEQ